MGRVLVGTVVLLTLAAAWTGCSSGVRPQDLAARSMEDVIAEADSLQVNGLERRATMYRDAIHNQQTEMERLRKEQSDLGYNQMGGEKAANLVRRMKETGLITSRLIERYQVYINKLHEKGVSTKAYEL
jgi:hypothetical protein